ncbi:hypothetical protein MNBD_BACTEROID02-293 [hydrothermal vent metagenome]|uniref:Uncharacterized protein n=1 Tax=hydrothermal vent metagenome TaxID=652676 RepID=A0A3B0R9H1_9ZZZZ
MKFSHYIWAIYLIIYPFYFFAEGNPQIADIFGVLLIVVNFKSIMTSISTNRFTKNLFLFIVYALILNTVWMLILGDFILIKNCIFYVYCYFLTLVIFNKIKEESFLLITLKALSIALIIQAILWPFIKSQGVRTQMFFNNPNQLALWGICLLIIIYVLARILKVKEIYSISLFLLSTLFIIISASRAALLGGIVFWLFYIFNSRKHFIIAITVFIIGIIFINYNYDIKIHEFAALEYNAERFSKNGLTSDQSFGGRGYGRIIENPQYLLFGAGEGEYERFNESIELHSILANILFSYGIIGLMLYLGAFASFTKKMTLEVFVILFIIAFFGSVHMTLRIPLFWITLLFVIYLHEEKSKGDSLLNSD